MTRRIFTYLVLVFSLLFTGVFLGMPTAKAQQVSFSLSPNTISPNVGDVVSLNVVVTNFTNITSLQLAIDWDPLLFDTVKPMIDNITLANPSGFDSGVQLPNTLRVSWVPGSSNGTVPNGQAIFRIRFKVKAASSNYWARFLTSNTELEVTQNGNIASPSFGNLGIPPDPAYVPVSIKTSSHTVQATENFCVGVTADNFTTIERANFSMKWDSSVLVYQSLTKFNATLGINATNFVTTQAVANGRLNFSFNSTPGKTVPTGDTLYKICFLPASGSVGKSTTIQTLTTGVQVNRTVGGSSTSVGLTPANGSVSVINGPPPPPGALTFSATTQTGNVGDTVCVRIFAKNFKDIAIMTWSMHWDSTKMSLVKARIRTTQFPQDSLVLTPPLINPTYSSNVNTFTYKTNLSGTLIFLADLSNAPVTLTGDSTLIFDVCLKINSGAGTSSNFIFDGVPLKIKVLDPNVVTIIPTFAMGKITISANTPLVASGNVTNVSCNGGNTGSIVLTASGGTGTYTYSWISPNGFTAATKDITTRTAGSYAVTVSSGTAAPQVLNFTITEPAVIASTETITNVNCFGQSTASVTLSAPTGGTAPYTYLWSSGETISSISAKAAGSFSVTITDSKSCTLTKTVSITQPTAALSSTEVPTNVNCFGQATGSIVVTPAGGTAPYTYIWSSGEITKDIGTKTAGSYTVTITDAKSCTLVKTATIGQPAAALSATNTVTNVKCNGGNDGAIVLTVLGGTSGYTYSWIGPNGFTATTKDIATLKVGGYSGTITDSKNCAYTLGPISITEPASMTVTPSVTNASCGTNTGAISITVAGGNTPYTYKWTGPNGYMSTNKDITGLEVGSYTLEITDNTGCKKTFNPISVSTTNPSFSVSNAVVNVSCNGGTDGSISTTVTGGNGNFTYTWAGTGFSATSKDVLALKAGNYTLTVTESGTNCKVIPTIPSVTEPSVLVIAAPQIVDVKCKGDKSGEIKITVSGGTAPYNYAWTSPSGFTANNTSAIGPLNAGVYNVTVTDAKGCTKTTTAEVKEPTGTAVTMGTPSVTNAKCNGASNGAIVISVSGGTPGVPAYTYIWSGPNGITNTLQNISNLAAGTYKVTATDANGCKANSNDIIVGQPAVLAVTGALTNAESACNGRIDITATGGTAPYTYKWTGKDVSATSEDQIKLCPGETYTVTITDGNDCTVSRTFTVTGTIAPPIRLTDSLVVAQAGCPGQSNGEIRIDFSGGKAPFTFEWLNSSGSVIGLQQNITGLSAGKYRVRIKDAVNQTYISGEIEIKESASTINVTLSSVKPESCSGNDGEVRISVTGGSSINDYKYTWNNGATSKDLTSSVKEGKYSVTVSDINKCLGEKKDIMVDRTFCPLTTNATVKTVNCFGDKTSVTVNIQNGEPGYVIKWTANDSVRVNNTPSRAGSYEITGLAAGSYTISVIDARGQVATSNITVVQPSEIKITKFVANDSGNCTGNIVLEVIGGTPQYSYVWNDGARSRDRFNLCTGQILSVIVTDAKGCFASTKNDTIRNVTKALVLTNSVNITNALCPDDATGKIDITVEGGVKPYKFDWSDGSKNEDPATLKPGTYSVTVTDNTQPNPNKVTGTYVIGSSSTLKIKDLVPTTNAATVTFEGGEAPYIIAWCNATTQNSSNTTISQSLIGGSCGVTVTDSKGCKVSRKFDVLANCAVVLTPNSLPCANSTGSASIQTVTDQSLTPPYLYRWDNNETGTTALKLAAGARTVTVVGNNGKTCIANFIMRAPEALKVLVLPNVAGTDCTLEASISGGVTPYKYKWSTAKGDTTARIKDLTNANNYFVVVKDANGCDTDPGVSTAVCKDYCLKGGAILTPNDDAKNDKFTIQKCDYKNVLLQVFNRWGQLVYQNDDYTDQWEGTNLDGKTGKELPEGVYMYVLKGTEPNGKVTKNQGTVNILRQ